VGEVKEAEVAVLPQGQKRPIAKEAEAEPLASRRPALRARVSVPDEEDDLSPALAAPLKENQKKEAEQRAARAAIEGETGKRLHPILGDGNCFYRSVAWALGIPS